MQTSLQNAKLSWNDAGAPISDSFEDVYFSNDNGLQETRYVFLQQNNLPERWLIHDRPVFVIAETGFGTGLNFLATWQAFRQQKQAVPETKVSRLHFISFEKFPLTRQDLQRALCAWPELTEFSESLIAAYPAAIPGCQRLRFDQGNVILDLWFGDVNDLLPQVYSPRDGLVDAWYLDGFAPSKNPDMWSENLFTQLYRLIRPQGTLATFTAAGFVRRGLTTVGFEMAKMPGHGKKREMLFGRSQKTPNSPLSAPNSVAIVGGGIASAWLSYLLTQRGYQVVLFCADPDVAQAASGNPQGAIYPLLHKPADPLSQFFSSAFHYCRQLIHEVHNQSPITFDWCGVLLKAFDEKSSQRIGELLATHFPPELIHGVTDGALFPQGGWVIPDELTHTLFQLAAATGLLTQHFNCEITAIHEQQGSWCLSTAADESYIATVLILANGAEVSRYQQTQTLPITPFRGQISSIEAVTDKENATPVVCGDGYILPARNGQQVIGATYIRNDTDRSVRDSEHQENKVKMQRTLAVNSSSHRIIDGRAAIRGVTRNHFPVVGGLRSDAQLNNELTQHSSAGGLPDMTSNLLIFAGLGSRGLCSAPLAAEILISLLLQEPVPCSLEILRELDPQRRQLKPLWRKQHQKSVRSNTRI